MATTIYRVNAVLLLLVLSTLQAAEIGNDAVLEDYLQAYNAHNIDAMLEHMDDAVRWMNVDGNQLVTATTGKVELHTMMTEYFAQFPSAQSKITQIQTVGDFIATVERASWERESATRSQCAIAVYAFKNQLIADVWYHIAQPCED